MPFEDDTLLRLHFKKHKNEFTFASAEEYQSAADVFMSGPVLPPVRECVRPNGDRIRFNRGDRWIAIQASSGWLKTFHAPGDKYIRLAYFQWECKRSM